MTSPHRLPHNVAPAIHKAINFYHAKLVEKHQGKFLTHNLLYILNEDLQKLQEAQRRAETHPVWNIPVKVIPNPKNPQVEFMVVEDNGTLQEKGQG